MADEKQQTSAIFKRHEQLKRWEDSETNKCLNHTSAEDKTVKFHDGCVFLAACSSGDPDEVKRLLERGADINTANIDGLTALHQACIDDNLDMVEFLVEHGADVDVCDNEGWTPLHATASCGFSEIARYLLRRNANVAAVNNDGDLPYDICEDDTMEKLLQECMDEQGVDADAARREEEDCMMEDANQWLNSVQKGEPIEDEKHPKTGATALHVASAKGYVKVMTVLLQADSDINVKDLDGWTPLHAAAHWGQEESCKILAENMCDMEAKNLAGQTAFDVADTELVKLLEELKLKQASLKDQQKDSKIIQTKLPTNRRRFSSPELHDSGPKPLLKRSSVTRMSVEQKHNVMKNVDGQERATLDVKIPPTKEEEKTKSSSSSSSCSEDEGTSESETEKKNELNKKTLQENQPRDRDKPPIMTTVEIKEKQPTEMPKIEESVETLEKENIKFMDDENEEIKNELIKDTEVIDDRLKKDKIFNNDKMEIQNQEKEKEILKSEKTDDALKDKENVNNKEEKKSLDINEDKKKELDKDADKVKVIEKVKEKDMDKATPLIENVAPKKDREVLKRTVSAPPSVTEVPKITFNTKTQKDYGKSENEIPSWRLGLRKTGSTSMVPHDSSVNKPNEDDKNLPRSASSPRLAEEKENKKNEKNDKPVTRRPYHSSSSFSAPDHNSNASERSQGIMNTFRYSAGSTYNSNSNSPSYQSSYVPYYRRQQLENDRKERERSDRDKDIGDKENNRIPAPASLPIASSVVTTTPAVSTTSSSTTITTPTSSFTHYRKSYEPPKRDEETEMLRKVRAKRARETRRSTQGVTLEEVQQANEVLRKTDPVDPNASSTATTTTTSTTTTITSAADHHKSSSDVKKCQDVTDSVNKDAASSDSRDVMSRLTGDVNLRRTKSALDTDSSSISSWRRSRDIEGSKKEEDITSRSSSFRRSRAERDLTSSTPSSSLYSTDSTYVPRNRSERADHSERNALSVADIGNTSLGGNLTRSASLRTDRLHSTDEDGSRIESRRNRDKDKDKAESYKDDKDDRRPESAAIRSRRMRRERRSTGIAIYTPEVIQKIRESAQEWANEQNKEEEDDKDKENKEDNKDEIKTDKSDTDDKSSRYNRYGSTSDVPTHITRPTSYSEYSRSTPSLEKDYRKLYEDEKLEKERLKRDLEQCKKELREAKVEIDRQMKKNEANRVSDTNDKRERRALERKLSELEEEIKKMGQLKEDNRRLREENGALIRVISKLSK